MIDFLEQNLVSLERGFQFALIDLMFDRHAEDVRGALQEREIVFAELAI